MLVIGLTGSIGMGKSTVAGFLRSRAVAVCDADAIVHELYAGRAVPAIEAAFAGTTRDGKVDREALSKALLADPAGFARLEAIVHPLVLEAEREFLAGQAAQNAAMAVLEIPLLFETGGDERCDVTIVVSAPAAVQRRRVLERPGMTAAKLEAILSRQISDSEKRLRADFVVDTGGTLEATELAVAHILEALQDRTGTAFDKHWSGQ